MIALLSRAVQRLSEAVVDRVLSDLSSLEVGSVVSCEVGKIGLQFFRLQLQPTCVVAAAQDEFDMRCEFDQGS